MTKSISFNSFSLQDTNWRTKDIIYRNLPQKVLDMEPRSRRDGFRLINSYYSDKQITISGTVTADTEANLRVLIDNMKKALNTDESILAIEDGSGTVDWTASVSQITVPEQHYHITRVPFEITFVCQPFGMLSTPTTVTNSVNTNSVTRAIVIIGSANPRPVIRWTVSGTPSAPITELMLTNDTTNTMITVPALILDSDGDYVEIDTEGMAVKFNGDEVDFTGVFPEFETSTNSYTVAIVGGGASKLLNELITYSASYL